MPEIENGNLHDEKDERDPASEARDREKRAEEIDRSLRVKVPDRDGMSIDDRRLAVSDALSANISARQLRAERDQLLRNSISFRLLELTNCVRIGDLDRAREILALIKEGYLAQTRIQAEFARLLHVSSISIIQLEEIGSESRERLHLLELAIVDLWNMCALQDGSEYMKWRRVAEVVSNEIDPLVDALRNAELSPEIYAERLTEAIAIVLTDFLPSESLNQINQRKTWVQAVATTVGINLISSAIWGELDNLQSAHRLKSLFDEFVSPGNTITTDAKRVPGHSFQTDETHSAKSVYQSTDRWRIWFPESNLTSPVISDGIVYCGVMKNGTTNQSFVAAIELKSGQEVWRQLTQDCISTPAVGENGVYVLTYQCGQGFKPENLIALERVSGKMLWRFPISEGTLSATPCVSHGVVLVRGTDGNLRAIDASTGEERWHYWSGYHHVLSDPVVDLDTVFVTGQFTVGSPGASHLYAIDVATGLEHWRFPKSGAWPYAWTSPTVSHGKVLVHATGVHPRPCLIFAIDSETGKETWWYPTIGTASDPAVSGEVVVFGSVSESELGIGHNREQILALAVNSGEVLWTARNCRGFANVPVVMEGMVLVRQGSDLVALSSTNGMELWRTTLQGEMGRPASSGGAICVATRSHAWACLIAMNCKMRDS